MSKEFSGFEFKRFDMVERRPTAPRFSFMLEDIDRKDDIVGDAFERFRLLTYPSPNFEQSLTRDGLMQQGYVLGKQVLSKTPRLDSFVIPGSTRPIVHDRPMISRNVHDYCDPDLFYDLGKLVSALSCYRALGYEITNLVDPHIGLVNFTKKDERMLWLIPGFERYSQSFDDGTESILDRYVMRLSAEFGERFNQNASQFIEGFEEK